MEVVGEPTEHRPLDSDGNHVVECFGVAQVGFTTWEHFHNADMLGPEYAYNIGNERIVVDWDDTIKSTGIYWIQAHREVLEDFGFDEEETSDDNILKLFGNIHVADTLGIDRFSKDKKEYTDDEVWGLISGRARQLLAENPIDPLVVASLKLAKQMGVQFAVWSSSPRELILEAIEANDLNEVFTAVVGVDDVDPDKHKPNPQGLLMAAHAMDVAVGYLRPDEPYSESKPLDVNGLWMVGDSPNDILGGKSVGASTVWLENPLQGHNAHEKRRTTIKNMVKKAGTLAVEDAVETMRPTLVARTFDPEEGGFGRNVPMSEMPMETVRNLSVTNYNFAHFLVDRNARALLHRREAVTNALAKQGISIDEGGSALGKYTNALLKGNETPFVDSSVYGNELSGVKTLTDRKFGPIDRKLIHRTLASIRARSEGPWV
jgi:phosphoglycolate phosphatase-like HAD superfamily hydrolase